MRMLLAGVVLIVFGALYVRRPSVYRRGLWLKTSLAIRLLSEANYRRYMRGLGIVFVVTGVVLAAYGVLALSGNSL